MYFPLYYSYNDILDCFEKDTEPKKTILYDSITLRKLNINPYKAFYIVSKDRLISQVILWEKYLPSIKPYYALKSNPDPKILEWLRETKKVSVDCASPNEIELATTVGYKSNEIIYANTMKSNNDIKESLKYGVNLTTVDSVEAVEQIAKLKWNPNILVRLAVDDSAAKSPFSIKFGARKEEWNKIVNAIDYHQLRLNGVSFHVGSASSNPSAFKNAILQCRAFQKQTKKYLHTVDIGGGFLPGEIEFKLTSEKITEQKDNWELDGNSPKRWIAEPGRFFSNPVQTLYTPIVFCKESEYNRRYIIDDSLYGQFTSIPFDHSQPFWQLLDKELRPIYRKKTQKDALFFGKTCDSMDFIALHKQAPKYEVGDILAFPNMGAYTSATASKFNGFELPEKIYTSEILARPKIKLETDILFPISIKSDISLSISKELK
jgi:ornithine decarboxylase